MQPTMIAENVFHALIAKRAQRLLGLASYVSQCARPDQVLVRPLMGELRSQGMQLEELLDRYDARNNCRWCSFRSITAAIKQFSDISYELLHIKHALPAYQLLSIESDFLQATDAVLNFMGEILQRASLQMLHHANILGLEVHDTTIPETMIGEQLPPGRLPRNCGARRRETVDEMVALLATAFLNLAAESKDVRMAAIAKPEEYQCFLTDAVREEGLRSLELRFHNLQSQYDTYVAGTQVEREDRDLLVLRGHISVVFHLLTTATLFAHYYERHATRKPCQFAALAQPLVDTDQLVQYLMQYSIMFTGLYITCAEQLCREMLKRYAEVGTVEVTIPRYRGFHVRPSTLISKLALHYGSEMLMKLGDESYNARMPLELFRANEKINAEKRRCLAMEVVQRQLVVEGGEEEGFDNIVRGVVLALAETGKVIMYEQPLRFPEEPARRDGTLLERVIAEVTRLLTLGKIDVDFTINVVFEGDTRVLADIQLLAEAGYGEDKFGNNIPLPEKLKYLRR